MRKSRKVSTSTSVQQFDELVRTVKAHQSKKEFIKNVESELTIRWDNIKPRAIAIDVLYILGVSLNKKKYSHLDGFNRFLDDTGLKLPKLFKKRKNHERT